MTERPNPIAVPIATVEAAASAPRDASPPLSAAQRRTLRAAAALVIPASARYGVPGADDEAITADMERTLGRDHALVVRALARLDAAAGGELAAADPAQREAAGRKLREEDAALATALAQHVVACYYRDDRVMRSLGLEPRAPHPQGYEVEPGDLASLLEPVRARGRIWRALP